VTRDRKDRVKPRIAVFVRHGLSVVDKDVSERDWPLDPAHAGEIAELRAVVGELPVICSDMIRAVETANSSGSRRSIHA
jgi:broad specificity phosphatase PhoE